MEGGKVWRPEWLGLVELNGKQQRVIGSISVMEMS